MECRDTERLMDAYLDRALPAEASRDVEAHLAGCPTCRGQQGSVVALLTSPPPVEVPAGLRDRVVGAVASEDLVNPPASPLGKGGLRGVAGEWGMARSAPRWTRFLAAPWSGAVAASVALVLMGWLIWYLPVKSGDAGPGGAVQPVQVIVRPPESPWVLSGWARAMVLPGTTGPAAVMAQGVAMDWLAKPVSDEVAVISVRRRVRPDEPAADDELVAPVLPLFLPGVSKLSKLSL